MWYWAWPGIAHLGKIIVVGAKDSRTVERLGYESARSVAEALEMAKDVVGPSPDVTFFHFPPIYVCDLTGTTPSAVGDNG